MFRLSLLSRCLTFPGVTLFGKFHIRQGLAARRKARSLTRLLIRAEVKMFDGNERQSFSSFCRWSLRISGSNRGKWHANLPAPQRLTKKQLTRAPSISNTSCSFSLHRHRHHCNSLCLMFFSWKVVRTFSCDSHVTFSLLFYRSGKLFNLKHF